MTATLDVAIGLVFIYLVLSVLASAVAEAIEHFYRYRAEYLRQGIEKLLLAGDAALREKLYGHPLIASLYTRSAWEGTGIWAKVSRAGGPSYIPTRQFVLAFLDVVTRTDPSDGITPAALPSSPSAVLEAVEKSAEGKLIPQGVAGALRTLIADAGTDMQKLKASVGDWFDGSMDRVAGWYKRRAQFVLLIIGIVIAVVINADTLAIVDTLSNDSAVRAAVVAAAEEQAREGLPAAVPSAAQPPTAKEATTNLQASVQSVVSQLDALGLPVGWRYFDPGIDPEAMRLAEADERRYLVEQRVWPRWSGRGWTDWLRDWWNQAASHAFGWLLTAIAVSFGAPFWFDLLNKVMVIRSTVKPREKSREEASEDRRVPSGGTQTVRVEIAPTK